MKIRNGFVSNSSSSSFICNVCGYMETGYDGIYDGFEYCVCKNGHTFCRDHIINMDKLDTDEYLDSDSCWDDIPEIHCPICQLEYISDENIISFICKQNNEKVNEYKNKITNEIKNKFDNYKKFKSYIGEK